MVWKCLSLFLLSMSVLLGQQIQDENGIRVVHGVALLIGNIEYQFTGALTNAVTDATELEKVLKKLGWKTFLKTNLKTKTEMSEAVEEWVSELEKTKAVALFFYAGHGIQIDGINYLVPTTAKFKKKVEEDLLSTDSILKGLKKAENEFNILILDAYRNNPFKGLKEGSKSGWAPINVPVGTYVVYGTSPEEEASDNPKEKMGLFTKHLLLWIEKPGLNIRDIIENVRVGVLKGSKEKFNKPQVVWEASTTLGKFYFVPSSASEIEPHPSSPTLEIFKAGPAQVNINSRFRYKIEISNPSESINTNVVVTDTLPQGLEFVDASGGGYYNPSTRIIKWNLGDLSPNENRELTVNVKAVLEKEAPGLCNVASVRSNEVPAKDSQACTLVEVVPTINIDGYDTADPVQVGDTTTYMIEICNKGKKASTQIQLVFTLDSKAEYVSHEASVLGRKLQGTVSGNTVTFDIIALLNPGDQATYKVTVKAVKAGSALGTTTITCAEFSKPFQKQEPTTFYK